VLAAREALSRMMLSLEMVYAEVVVVLETPLKAVIELAYGAVARVHADENKVLRHTHDGQAGNAQGECRKGFH
jgi:hypothetical protein